MLRDVPPCRHVGGPDRDDAVIIYHIILDRAHRSDAPRPSNGRSRESDDVFRSPSRVDFAPGRSTDRRPSSGYVELPQIPSSALESSVGPGRATDDRASPSNSRVESNDAKDAPRRSMCSTFCCHDFSDEVRRGSESFSIGWDLRRLMLK